MIKIFFICVFTIFFFRCPSFGQIKEGEPIPAGGIGQYGFIPENISGTGNVFGNGPYDLFAGLSGLYPFEKFDNFGTPVYGKRIVLNASNLRGYVFQHNEIIYALSRSVGGVQLLQFDKINFEFKEVSRYNINVGRALAGFIDNEDKLHIFHVAYDNTPITGAGDREPFPNHRSSRNKDDVPYHHQKQYNAFDGAGLAKDPAVYSKGPRLFHIQFSDVEMTRLEKNGVVEVDSPSAYFKFGCSGLTMAIYNNETKIPQVVGANQNGMTRIFQNISTTGVNIIDITYAVDNSSEHVILKHPVVNPKTIAIPNPKNGLSDLLISDSGRLWHYPLIKMLKNNTPIYGSPRLVVGKNENLLCGKLPVITSGDLNNDDLVDFLVGNDAGELLFIENIGSKKSPKFANPTPVHVDGKPLHIRAGYQGSIQGPFESSWGYTCPTLFDWNLDGRLDIVMNSILGDIVVFLQQDSVGSIPAFSEQKKIFCDGLDLHLAWRTQPGVTTWGGETVPCIITNDENNEFRCFYRIDSQNVIRGEVLRLETGEAIRAHDKRFVGQWGRSKIVPFDWDKDGKIDLIVGTGRAQSIPGEGGMPDNLKGSERQSSVLFMKNVGTNFSPKFKYPVRISYKGDPIKLGAHSCSPAPVDLGRGVTDLVVASEKGVLMYYNREELHPF